MSSCTGCRLAFRSPLARPFGYDGGMDAQPVVTAKPKRRRLQFSLATLLLLTLVCAVVLALFVAPKARQRRAVAYVESVNGRVEYVDAGDDAAHAPAWLREWLGPDYFRSVRVVELSETRVSDAGLAQLEGLTALEALHLYETPVSDAGLSQLTGLTALEELSLDGTQVSDAGLANLKGLRALAALSLSDTQVSDAGLSHLKGLTALAEMSLYDTQVSDAGLTHLKGLTALRWLDLRRTQVSNAGTADLRAALPNCSIFPGQF